MPKRQKPSRRELSTSTNISRLGRKLDARGYEGGGGCTVSLDPSTHRLTGFGRISAMLETDISKLLNAVRLHH